MNKTKISTTANADKDFGDCYFGFSENSKRVVRATLKTCDQTGTYVFLKVFKKATECAEFECVQRLSLRSEEFSKLLKSEKSIRAQTSEIFDTVENKDKPQSNCINEPGNLKFPHTQTISSTNRIIFSFTKWQKLCSKLCYVIISKISTKFQICFY